MNLKNVGNSLICGVAISLALSACTSVRDEIGLNRAKPDEFAVVPKAPLAMPPDFATLKEPEPGAPRPQQVSPSGEARAALASSRAAIAAPVSSQSVSAGELALVDAAGANKSDPKIRAEMRNELRDQRGQKSMAERILFWQGPEKEEWVVDAAAEAKRIERAKKQGEVLTGQGTPIIEKSAEKGLMGKLF